MLALALLVLLGVAGSANAACAAATHVLYDGSASTTPDAQGWAYLSRGGTATVGQAKGATTLDTTVGSHAVVSVGQHTAPTL